MTSTYRLRLDIHEAEAHRLLQTHEALALVERAAEECARTADDLAPVGRTGETARSYEAFGSEIRDGVATAYWGTRSSIYHIIEWGSVNNPPYRPMTRAVERVGLKYRPAR